MKTRKFVSNLLVAALATTPVALAAVSDLKEKVSPGEVPYLVVGEKAAASDVLAAADLAFALAALSKKEATGTGKVVVETGKTIIKGGIPLYKDTAKLYLQDNIAKVKPKIAFESGEVEGDEDKYKYRVELWPDSNAKILMKDKPDTDENDPVVLLIGGDSGDEPILTIKVKFETGEYLDLDDTKGSEIKILGKSFYLDKDDDGNVILRAAASKVTLNAGETYDFEDKKVKIEDIVKQGNTYYVKVSVNGKVKTIEVEDDDEINGVYVYVKGAYVSELEEGKGYAELILGGKKVVLKDGDGIEVNGELDKRVIPQVKKDDDGKIKEIDFDIYVSDDSDKNYIEAGKEFTPVLFDTIKLVFGDVDLKEGQKVELTPSGDKEYKLKITDWRDKSKTLTIAKLGDDGNVYMLEDEDKLLGTIIGTKNSPTTELAVDEKEYFAVFDDQTKESYLYKVDDISIDSDNGKADVTLKDEISGETVKLEDIPYGDGSSTEDWDVGHFVFKVYVDSSTDKLTFKNVDLDDSDSVLKDELKLYLQNEVILDAKQAEDIVDDTDGETEVKVTIIKDYAGVDEAESDPRLLELTIDDDEAGATHGDELKDPNIKVYNQIDEGSPQEVDSLDKGDDYEVWLSDLGVYAERYKNDDGLDRVTTYIPDEVRTYDVVLAGAGEGEETTTTVTYEVGDEIPGVGKIKEIKAEGAEALVPVEPKFTLLDKEAAGKSGVFVLVGGPCANNLVETIAKEEGVVPTCSTWGTERKAVLARATSGGNEYFVVAGTEAIDTRIAAKVLAYYLEGKEIPEDVKTALESKDVVWLDTTKATLDNPTNVEVKE